MADVHGASDHGRVVALEAANILRRGDRDLETSLPDCGGDRLRDLAGRAMLRGRRD
jgi:hypothetical protein